MKNRLFSYRIADTYIHRLSGLTKLICFLLLTFAVMFSYDIRVILSIMAFSLVLLGHAQIKFSQVRLMVAYATFFLVTNATLTYLFSPEEGVKIYGTRHEIARLTARYTLTQEQLFYLATKFLKYASVIPLGLIFLLTTNPSEFAAALNGVGVNCKAAYAVALTLRYFPDIQRDYLHISQAQQARGLELSKKEKFAKRVGNALLIIIPLVFSTLARIELISNAMDLRGFGKHKKRTWYNGRRLTRPDHLAILLSALIFAVTVLISVFINKSRFYNPFA